MWEEAYIEAAQQIAHNNMSQAARLLGVNRTTLYSGVIGLAQQLDRIPLARTRPAIPQ